MASMIGDTRQLYSYPKLQGVWYIDEPVCIIWNSERQIRDNFNGFSGRLMQTFDLCDLPGGLLLCSRQIQKRRSETDC